MPGVPSGRGCNACRRQKKKCDETKPACSRCARLKIDCVGAGQQRYKFHNQTVAITTPSTEAAGQKPPPPGASSCRPFAKGPPLVRFASPPSIHANVVISQLVTAFNVDDPRFDLSVYGPFLKDIPCRLGKNAALDAAADAMATALPLVQPHNRPSEAMLRKYGRALQALRICLSNRATASSSETLCALYVTVICQGWLRGDDQDFPSHGEAVSHILESMRNRSWEDPFERSIVTVLCFLVVLEGFINPRIRVDPDMWNLPETFGPRTRQESSTTITSLSNRNIARMVRLIRFPRKHPKEIVEAYNKVRQDRATMCSYMSLIPATLSPDGTWVSVQPIAVQHLHVRWLVSYGILTMMCMRLNSVMQASRGYGAGELDNLNPMDLNADLIEYIDSVIDLSERGVQYRPLGSSATPLFLIAAYTALDEWETERASRIRQLLFKYHPDFDLDAIRCKIQPTSKSIKLPLIGDDHGTHTIGHDERHAQKEAQVKAILGQSNLCCIL